MAAPADDKTFRVLTSAVEACTIADDVAGAERWMAALEDAKLAPPMSAYNLIIDTCARTGDPGAAKTWRSRMEKRGYPIDEAVFAALLSKYEGVERTLPEPVSPARGTYQSLIHPLHSPGQQYSLWSDGDNRPGFGDNGVDSPQSRGDEGDEAISENHPDFKMSIRAPEFKPQTPTDAPFSPRSDSSPSHGGHSSRPLSEIPTSPMSHFDSSLLKACARALKASRMIWSQNAMQARSWRAVSKMIDTYTQARTPEDVILWYDSMREFGCEPIKVTFDSAIEVYSHTGFVVGAVRWLTAMRAAGITPDEATFRWAKRACARASSVPEAEWCFESMIQAGLPPDVGAFTAVINVCAHSGDVGGAEKWFSTMHLAGIWPGAIAYNSVINAHAQAKDVAGAERWFQAMEASSTAPNEVTYSSVIKACAQAADVDGAEKWFHAMCKVGFVPNAVPFNTVLNACARARNVDKAEEWLRAMRSAGLQPDQVSYNVMIKAYALGADAVGAERWFDEMKMLGVPHDRKSYSALTTAYANTRPVPFDRVESIVKMLQSRKKHPDHDFLMSHDTLASVLKCCGNASPPRPEAAVQWFHSFIAVTHLNEHIEKALIQAVGETVAANEISTLRRTNPSTLYPHNYNQNHQQQSFQAKQYQNTHSNSYSRPGPSNDPSSPHDGSPPTRGNDGLGDGPIVYSSKPNERTSPTSPIEATAGLSSDVIVEVHAPEDLHRYLIGTRGVTMRQIQHESGARIFFPTTRNTPPWAEPSGPDCITIVGSKAAATRAKQLIAGRVADYYTGIGVKNPEQMFVRSEKEAMPVLQAHSAFAAEARAQDLLQGTSVPGQGPHTSPTLPQSPTAPHSPNHSGSFGTTTSMPLHSPPGAATDVQLDTVPSEAIIAACIRHTDHKGALSWFDAMKDAGLRSGRSKCSVCVAINACTDAKDAAGVVRWYTAVLAAGGAVNENTFNLAIKAFAHAGDVSGAEAWISAMWKVGFAPNAVSFNAVINRCARAGDVLSAERWLNLMQDAGAVPSQLTFNSIIQAYTLAADPIGAVRWFEAMQAVSVLPNEKTFSSIINAFAQAKNIAGAEQWFEEMQRAGFAADAVSFNTVINACAQVRDVQRAEYWLIAMQKAGLQANQVTYNVMIKAHALSGDSDGAEKWFEEMKAANFPHNLRSFSSMATAYGQAFTVDLDKVQGMVDEMRVLQLHPDHEVLTSLLKCCAHAAPPNPDLAIAWFKEFVPRAHLMAHVERALRQACGSDRADEAIFWAQESHPNSTSLQPWHGGGVRSEPSSRVDSNVPARRAPVARTNDDTSIEIKAPENCHRYLIGIRGAAIKQIQNKSGALVYFPNTKNTPFRARPSCKNTITIVGTSAACDCARNLLLVRLQNCRAFTTASEEGGDGFNGMAEENFEPSLSTDPPLAPTPVLPTGLWASIAKGKGPGTVTGRAASSATPRQSAHAAAATGTANGGGRDPTPDILKMCGHALRAAGMAWSRNALVTAGFQNIESSRIIDLCTSFSEGNGIVRWFEAMQALGCVPTEVTFTSAIKAYGYKKNTRTASAWLAAMQLVGIEPSQKAYCSIINAHVRAKDLSGAELWFQRLRSAGLEPDQVAFNIMMSAYTSIKDLGAAEAWFTMMCDNGFRESAPLYQAMIIAISQTRRVSIAKVKQVVQLMEANKVDHSPGVLAVLLKCCSRSATPQAALATQWFQAFIPTTQLTGDMESELLPLVVGRAEADRLVLWATQMYPQCRDTRDAPPSGRQAHAGPAHATKPGSSAQTPTEGTSPQRPRAAPGSERHAGSSTGRHEATIHGHHQQGGGAPMYTHPTLGGISGVHPHAPMIGSRTGMEEHQRGAPAGPNAWAGNHNGESSAVPYATSATVWGSAPDHSQPEQQYSEHVYYNQLVVQFALSGDLAGAERTIHAAQQAHCILDSPTYNAMIQIHAQHVNVKLMEQWLLATRSAGFTLSDPAILLPLIILAYARVGNGTEAERWLNVLLASRLRPSVETVDVVINVMYSAGRTRDAERLKASFGQLPWNNLDQLHAQ